MEYMSDRSLNTCPLSTLKPGQQGTITKIGGDKISRLRYMEMGLVNGETIVVLKKAPLGDPVQYRIRGYYISMRQDDAAKIMVKPQNGTHDD